MSPLVYQAENSLVRQSYSASYRKKPVNGDGFGLGWYPEHDSEPAVFRSIEPAWSNENLRTIASKIKTAHYFAHVRDASFGMPVSQSNCHPYSYGPYLWMHNGRLGGFRQIRRDLLQMLSEEAFHMIQGNTDSEHMFALFMDTVNFRKEVPPNVVKESFLETINRIEYLRRRHKVDSPAFLNLALSDGRVTLVSRCASNSEEKPSSLYLGHGEVVLEKSDLKFIENSSRTCRAAIVSSEPLDNNTCFWKEVEPNHLVVLGGGNDIQISSLESI